MIVCPQCSTANEDIARFCDNCGALLAAQPPSAQPSSAAPVASSAVAPGSVVANTCPACGTPFIPGEAFCSDCGAQLPGQPQEAYATPVAPAYTPPNVGARPRLVVAGSGAEFDLAGKSEVLIGREDPISGIFPQIDLAPHGGEVGGVSRRHARLMLRNGQWLIEDLNSTNFTFVNNQRLTPGAPLALKDGDQIRMGRVVLAFYMT